MLNVRLECAAGYLLMLIEKINLNNLDFLIKGIEPVPIVEDFFTYFSEFNLERVLIVTDEDIDTDIRVLNQIIALQRATENITLLKVNPDNSYTDNQKKYILKKLYFKSLINLLYFPWFLILVIIHNPFLAFKTRAKQGIYNDHSYFLSDKIDTSNYTCVICNNLISASSIDSHNGVDYIYDIHELEVFRNRNKASIQRSFYVYLKEMEELKKKKNIITISKHISNILSNMYYYKLNNISCIYNRNFNNTEVLFNEKFNVNKHLLIYIGSISLDRGLEDIVRLSFEYDILIIACNYREEAIVYLEENSNLCRLKIFKGMDYQAILLESIEKYQHPYFLILINPTHPSYRYALPNKFFQAQAVGCPIIAYDKTYLADIIKIFGCGLVFPNTINTDFLNSIDEIQYARMKQSMKIKVAKAIENKKL